MGGPADTGGERGEGPGADWARHVPPRPAAVLIAGPTASGKSALALDIAEALGGTIVNVDAMQLYADLRILTARPSPQDEARVPHRLYGVLDGAERASAGRFLELARACLAELRAEGRVPILTGGTGLYFDVMVNGIAAIPPVPDALARKIRLRMETEGPRALHAELAAADPRTAAGIGPTDSQRIGRALGVLAASGEGLAAHQARGSLPPLFEAGSTLARLFLAPPRPALHAAIERRFEAMLAAGALDEVAALAARGLDPSLPVMRAHGVPELMAHLAGTMSLEAAAAAAILNTRHYVKRQLTWARRRMADWVWLGKGEAAREGATLSARRDRV